MEIILSVLLVISLYFNYKFKKQIKKMIFDHLIELGAYETTVGNLKYRIENLQKKDNCITVCEAEVVKPKRKKK